MSLKPLGNRILIRKLDQATVSTGGIHLVGNAQDKDATDQGRVQAVGPGGRTRSGITVPISVEVGQVVIYPKYGGRDIEIKGEKFVIVAEPEILGVIHD